MSPIHRARSARVPFCTRATRIVVLATGLTMLCVTGVRADANPRYATAPPSSAIEGNNGNGRSARGCGAAPVAIPTILQPADPQTITVGQSVTFDGSASYDPDSGRSLATYLWHFADDDTQVRSVSAEHVFHTPDGVTDAFTVEVSLTVTDRCGQSDTGKLLVTVVQDNFVIKKQVRDPVTGDLSWNDISSLPDNPIELGLRIKFDGCGIPGASYFWFQYMDGGSSTVCDPIHAFHEGGSYEVKLTVWDDLGASHTTTRTVYVDYPMEMVGESPREFNLGVAFAPLDYVIAGDTMWAAGKGSSTVVNDLLLGQIDLSNPQDLGPFDLFPIEADDIRQFSGIAYDQNILGFATRTKVYLFDVTHGSKTLIHTFSLEADFAGRPIRDIEIFGHRLFVAIEVARESGMLYVFDLNDLTRPYRVLQLTVPVGGFLNLNGDFLIGHESGRDNVVVFDVNDPDLNYLVTKAPAPLTVASAIDGHDFLIASYIGWIFGTASRTANGTVAVSFTEVNNEAGGLSSLHADRVYVRFGSGDWLGKYDITNPSEVYEMERVYDGTPLELPVFAHSPGSATESTPATMFVGWRGGLRAYAPPR